jgi:hypothetical protein
MGPIKTLLGEAILKLPADWTIKGGGAVPTGAPGDPGAGGSWGISSRSSLRAGLRSMAYLVP